MRKKLANRCCWSLVVVLVSLIPCYSVFAAEVDTTSADVSPVSPSTPADNEDSTSRVEAEQKEPPRLPAPKDARPMPKPNRVWIDTKKKLVYVDGYVSLTEGVLEMFACPAGTKEHESIVAVHSSAQVVHAGLLAVGAKVGHPVKWDPTFEPATGTEIEIEVHWRDPNDKWHKTRAQEWIRDIKTDKAMKYPWVFAGSGFWTEESTGKEYYMAEGGDLVCVSNFSTATLDIPVESSQSNHGLLFEAYTKKIPPIGTPVRLVLKPKLKEAKEKAAKEPHVNKRAP